MILATPVTDILGNPIQHATAAWPVLLDASTCDDLCLPSQQRPHRLLNALIAAFNRLLLDGDAGRRTRLLLEQWHLTHPSCIPFHPNHLQTIKHPFSDQDAIFLKQHFSKTSDTIIHLKDFIDIEDDKFYVLTPAGHFASKSIVKRDYRRSFRLDHFLQFSPTLSLCGEQMHLSDLWSDRLSMRLYQQSQRTSLTYRSLQTCVEATDLFAAHHEKKWWRYLSLEVHGSLAKKIKSTAQLGRSNLEVCLRDMGLLDEHNVWFAGPLHASLIFCVFSIQSYSLSQTLVSEHNSKKFIAQLLLSAAQAPLVVRHRLYQYQAALMWSTAVFPEQSVEQILDQIIETTSITHTISLFFTIISFLLMLASEPSNNPIALRAIPSLLLVHHSVLNPSIQIYWHQRFKNSLYVSQKQRGIRQRLSKYLSSMFRHIPQATLFLLLFSELAINGSNGEFIPAAVIERLLIGTSGLVLLPGLATHTRQCLLNDWGFMTHQVVVEALELLASIAIAATVAFFSHASSPNSSWLLAASTFVIALLYLQCNNASRAFTVGALQDSLEQRLAHPPQPAPALSMTLLWQKKHRHSDAASNEQPAAAPTRQRETPRTTLLPPSP